MDLQKKKDLEVSNENEQLKQKIKESNEEGKKLTDNLKKKIQ